VDVVVEKIRVDPTEAQVEPDLEALADHRVEAEPIELLRVE